MKVGFASRPFSRLTTAVSSPATKPPGEAASRSSILPSRRRLTSDLDCVLEDRPLGGGALVDHDDRLARAQRLRRRDRSVQHEVGEVAQEQLVLAADGLGLGAVDDHDRPTALGGDCP